VKRRLRYSFVAHRFTYHHAAAALREAHVPVHVHFAGKPSSVDERFGLCVDFQL